MYTRCPKCSTCFRVTDRHLAIAKGKVRCGRCQLVFNAPEHAIDDLPVNQNKTQGHAQTSSQSGPTAATSTKPPVKESNEPAKITTTTSKVTKAKADSTPKPEKTTETQIKGKRKAPLAEPIIKAAKPTEEKVEEPVSEAPVFKADATMAADISMLESQELNDVDLDTASGIQSAINDDDLFDDSFDLNAAIDELTQSSEDELSIVPKETKKIAPVKDKPTQDIPETNNIDDVFTTDAYAATSAGSVSEVLDEIGQLSLNIDEPAKEEKYDTNDEFEFIQLDDTNEIAAENINENFDVDEVDLSSDLENVEIENQVDEDELFDQVDLSDFNDETDNENNEDEFNLDLSNKKIVDDEVPFQLRNDLEHLQTPTRRRSHPLLSLFFILVLVVLSFSQLAYFRAHDLVNLAPSSRPLLEAFCEKFSCHYSGPRDSKKFQLLSRDVRIHPKEKKPY